MTIRQTHKAAQPDNMETDGIENTGGGGDGRNAQGSPCKRRGVGQDDAITMTLLREILKEQTRTILGEQNKILRELKNEIRTLERSCATQFQYLQQEVQAAERGIGEVRTIQTDFERRLQALETRGSEGSTPASATDTGRQRNALVLGGWDPDTASAEMLKHAQAIVRDLRLDLDTADMFVPGVRRGLAILPLRPREGESGETMNARVWEAISKVRAANVTPPGRTRSAWMTYSRTFAERRRAALAGKVKRLILQLRGQGGRAEIEVEWGSGTVWLGGARVASAASAPPARSEGVSTGGWTDVNAIAAGLRMNAARVRTEWELLAGALKSHKKRRRTRER